MLTLSLSLIQTSQSTFNHTTVTVTALRHSLVIGLLGTRTLGHTPYDSMFRSSSVTSPYSSGLPALRIIAEPCTAWLTKLQVGSLRSCTELGRKATAAATRSARVSHGACLITHSPLSAAWGGGMPSFCIAHCGPLLQQPFQGLLGMGVVWRATPLTFRAVCGFLFLAVCHSRTVPMN